MRTVTHSRAGSASPSGGAIPVMHYQELNLSHLVSPTTLDVILMDRIPIAPYTVVGLTVRVHELTVSSGGKFEFFVYGVDPSPVDGRDFVTSTQLGKTSSISGGTIPRLETLNSVITNPQTPFARVLVRATGPSSAGTLFGIFSADLTMKTG